MKKILAVVICLVFAFAMAAPVMAQEKAAPVVEEVVVEEVDVVEEVPAPAEDSSAAPAKASGSSCSK